MTDAVRQPTGTAVAHVPYDELPLLHPSGLRHAWNVYGEQDELGTLNQISDEVVRSAATLVRTGQRCSLDLPITVPDPPMFGRPPFVHSIYALDRNTWDDHLDAFALQGSTQWDGLRHVRAREFGFYGGWQGPPDSDPTRLGVDRWTQHGFVSRGVLVDLTAGNTIDPFVSRAISPDELADAVSEQCGELRQGDVLCIRTGWTERYLELDPQQRRDLAARDAELATRAWAGLDGSEQMARYLWDSRIAAVACDNPALEVAPGDAAVGDLHRRLIPCLGLAIGELFDFSELVAACDAADRRDFLFVAVPLRLPGGVGSPGNAMAIL